MKVEFYRHQLAEHDILTPLGEVFGSVFLTTGPKTGAFESAFSDMLGVKHTIGLSSCTAGLFLCLKAWGIGPGDEVIVPAMTFVASSNAILHCGATPVFADVDSASGLMRVEDAAKKITPKTKAVIPVHLYGRMADMRGFRAFADKHGIRLLEDAAHCVEGRRDGVGPGQLGDAVCFSFYATKNITCGEGGALSTNDGGLAERVQVLRLHGLDRDAAKRHQNFRHWDMIELGYKFNMNDIQAAMLLPQLETLDTMHDRRECVNTEYITAITAAGLPIRLPETSDDERHARHLFVIRTEASLRNRLIEHFRAANIGVTVNYRAVHLNSFYQETLGSGPGLCPDAEKMGEEVLSLPFYPSLETNQVRYVVDTMAEFFEKERI